MQHPPTAQTRPTDRAIAQLMWQVYEGAPLAVRILASVRTYICPMAPLVADVPEGSTIFDIGCGNGLFLSLLVAYDRIKGGLGTDLQISALESARLAATRLGREHSIFVDFLAIETAQNWPTETFSVVSMIDVMHHIPPSQQYHIFASAIDRLAPEGRLIYKDMCRRPWWKALANRLHDLFLAKAWIHYVPIETIKQWGEACGLQLEQESHYSRYFYGHEKLVFRKR
jgi:2-polyprenyl-3-methyl-5-hydroxy-6-metoxy-1,4-benzoquinol methylase